MRFRGAYLWIITSVLGWFVDWYTGLIVSIATIVILIQDNEIRKMRRDKDGDSILQKMR